LELPWYEFWTIALNRLAAKLHPEHCYVSPQLPLWRLWIEEEDGDDEPEFRLMDTEEEDDLDEDVFIDTDDGSSIDLESVTDTWRGQKYKNRITDFALIFRASKERPPEHDSDLDSDDEEPMQVLDLATIATVKYYERVPVLVEIKRFVSRSEPPDKLNSSIRDRLALAKADVLTQACVL
jgi:hypothetical protein